MYMRLLGCMIFALLMPMHLLAHGDGVISCDLTLKQGVDLPNTAPLPQIVQVAITHYEFENIGIIGFWGAYNGDPEYTARVVSTGKEDSLRYSLVALSWETTYPELIMRPDGQDWSLGRLYWTDTGATETDIGTFRCDFYFAEKY